MRSTSTLKPRRRPPLVQLALATIESEIAYLDGAPVHDARPGEKLDQLRALLAYVTEIERRPGPRRKA
jgi:hypothetical protein